MKFFSKSETFSLIVIFLSLIVISWPNFRLSLRRARDQTRRDDMGYLQSAIDTYYVDHGFFPRSTPDGKFAVCKGIDGKETTCEWGQKWVSSTLGDDKVYVDKVYMNGLPQDPGFKSGTSFVFFSDPGRYQIMGALEGEDEAEYDAKLVAQGIKCGNKICNFGRAYNVPLYMTIEEYNLMIFCKQHPENAKCIK
jgi:type II secretory pathway pseudopilin PulG